MRTSEKPFLLVLSWLYLSGSRMVPLSEAVRIFQKSLRLLGAAVAFTDSGREVRPASPFFKHTPVLP